MDETRAEAGREQRSRTPVYATGDHIAGRYEVLDVVGAGANGVVYRARDLAVGEVVAVKLIHDTEAGVDALRSELRLARQVTHRNVCRVFDLVEHRDGALLTMEYMSGGTLAARVGPTPSVDEVRKVACEMLSGLAAAHDVGVVHRDIKPANVLIAGDGRLAISDFGIARPIEAVAETGARGMTGTPAYMSPEQLTGDRLDARTDLYSVGLILYELIAGHLPFAARGEQVVMPMAARRLTREIPALDSPLWPAIEPLLSRDPARRPADAGAALARFDSDAGAGRHRRRRLLAVTAAVAALVAGGTVAMLAGGRQSDRAPANTSPATIVAPEPITRTLTGGGEMIRDAPTFAGGGTELVVSTNRSGELQLWAIDRDGANARQLTRSAGAKRAPQVVGGQLYYLRGHPGERFDLVRVPAAALASPPIDGRAELVATGLTFVDVAPSGRLVALDTDTGAGVLGALTVIDPASGERRELTERGELLTARWSLDEQRIAYIERHPEDNDRGVLWVMDVASGTPRKLADDIAPFGGLVWTASGASVAFFRGAGDSRSLHAVRLADGSERVIARRLRRGTLPALSPSGSLAYVTDLVDVDVWVYDPASGLQRVTALGDQSVTSPSWVPESNELAYQVHLRDGSYEVRRVRADTFSEVTARRPIDAWNEYIVMTPDGRHAVYGRQRAGEWQLVSAEIDSRAEPVVLDRARGWGVFPNAVTADGERVTYARFALDSSGASELWEVRLDGNGRRRVPGAGGGYRSHDGRWLGAGGIGAAGGAGDIEDRGRLVIYRIDERLALTGESMVVPHTEQFQIYRFGPGLREMTATDARELYRVDLDSGERTRLAELPRGLLEPDRMSVHPDGRVAMMLRVGDRRVVVLDNFAALDAATR